MVKYIIGIHGKQGAGKSSLASNLKEAIERIWGYQVLRLSYAGPVYDIHDLIQEYLEQYGVERVPKKGPLLQSVGDIGRNLYSPNFWVDLLEKSVAKVHIQSHDNPVVVIVDDVRYPNEAGLLKTLAKAMDAGTALIRLHAPEEVRKGRCSNWRENTTHSSEVALDYAENIWDLDLDTAGCDPASTLTHALEYVEHALALSSPETVKVEKAVAALNDALRWLKSRNKGANFRWDYLPDGTKHMSLISVEPIEPLSKEREDFISKLTEETIQDCEDIRMGIDTVLDELNKHSNGSGNLGPVAPPSLPPLSTEDQKEFIERVIQDQCMHGADCPPVDPPTPVTEVKYSPKKSKKKERKK